jgi:glycine oxidase
MTEVLIVGNGLAANVLAFQLHLQQVSFRLIGDKNLSACSFVAAGIWNPMVFKRMTNSWMAQELISELLLFYKLAEAATQQSFLTQRQIVRSFHEEQEIILWQKKAETEAAQFLDKTIYLNKDERLIHCKSLANYSFVNQCGNLNVARFMEACNSFFNEQITDAIFEYNELSIHDECISYKGEKAKQIVFCEGYLVKHNPLFNWIPLVPAKGEIADISIPNLNLNNLIFNRDGFLFQTEPNTYRVGATYNWKTLNDEPSQEGLNELQKKVSTITDAPYTVLKHQAGVRPSSKDRRPIIGEHPNYKNVFIFNGLGTKGVMLAPYFSKNFVLFLKGKEALHEEVDVKRFYSLAM